MVPSSLYPKIYPKAKKKGRNFRMDVSYSYDPTLKVLGIEKRSFINTLVGFLKPKFLKFRFSKNFLGGVGVVAETEARPNNLGRAF